MDGRPASPPVYNLVPSEPIAVADAHFHLDQSVRCNSGAVPYGLDAENTQQTFNTTLKFLIANYVYPDSWPSSSDRSEAWKDQRIYFTFGLHPRLIFPDSLYYLCSTFRRLETWLGSTRTVAVGECGLDEMDRTRHRDLQKQIVYFEKQLHLALCLNLPVVVHSRGWSRIQQYTLDYLVNILPRYHPIHWHCFTASTDIYSSITYHFYNIVFGVTLFLLSDRYPNIRQVIQTFAMDKIVLESDALYIPLPPKSQERRSGNTFLVHFVAKKIFLVFP